MKDKSADSLFNRKTASVAGSEQGNKPNFQLNGKAIQDLLGIEPESTEASGEDTGSLKMMDIVLKNWEDINTEDDTANSYEGDEAEELEDSEEDTEENEEEE